MGYAVECNCGWVGTSDGLNDLGDWWECPMCGEEAEACNEVIEEESQCVKQE